MRRTDASKMLALSAACFVGMLALAGCNSVRPRQLDTSQEASANFADQGRIVHSGMELYWSCKSPTDQAGLVRSGKSVVGPDGKIVLGPYGACSVAGLTLQQASAQVEKQLAPHVKHASVTLTSTAEHRSAAVEEIVWRKATPGEPLRRVGGTQPQAMPRGPQPPTVTVQPKDDGLAGPSLLPMPHPQPLIVPGNAEMPTHAAGGRPIGRHHAGSGMMALPHGPNEMNPTLLPEYVIRPPDVLVIETTRGLRKPSSKEDKEGIPQQPIRGPHLVRPDGTVSLGIYGPALVAGRTVEQARTEVARAIKTRLTEAKLDDLVKDISGDVLAYNSSFFYVISDGAGQGAQVTRFPITGSETVLDAISLVNGLSPVSSPKRIWVARRNAGNGAADHIYPVDWKGISMQGSMATNWQIMPGDRVYVQSDPVRRFNNNLQKYLEPVERVLGGMLLGSQTANSIRSGTTGFR